MDKKELARGGDKRRPLGEGTVYAKAWRPAAVCVHEGMEAVRSSTRAERQTGYRSEEFCEPAEDVGLAFILQVEHGGGTLSQVLGCLHGWEGNDLQLGGFWADEEVTGHRG